MPYRSLLLLSLLTTPVAAEDWPQFRGPSQQGVVPSGEAPVVWSESENVLWKTPLPGRGWSSPVVLGDQIWLTTAIEKAAAEEEKENLSSGMTPARNLSLASRLSLRALCVDRKTGELLHNIDLFDTGEVNPIHSLNSYASPTPVLEKGRLYCHFGTYGNACIDTDTGEVLWRRVLPLEHYVGPGSSPVVYENLLILTYDGADVQYVTALDKATGDTVWKTDRPPIRETNPDFRKSYCTPLVVSLGGSDQVIIPGAQWVVAYEPTTGEEIWRVDHGRGFSVVPRPVSAEGVVYFSSGFGGGEMLAVRLDGVGDVTDSHVLWRSKRQTPTQPSPALAGDQLFTVSDNGVGVCLDTKNGRRVWQKRMAGKYSASPLLAGDLIYFFSREGKTTLVRNDPAEPLIERTNMLDGQIMATPAVVDGVMLIRTATHLYAISEKPIIGGP